MTEEQLMTTDEVKNLLGVSNVRIHQIRKAGELEGRKRAGVWFYFPASVRTLVEKRAAKKAKRVEKKA